MHRLFGLILLVALFGCENVLEIELEQVHPEMVVTSTFTENEPWQVLVHRTVGIQEDATLPSIVGHAIVTIEGSDGSFLELTHKGGGFYYGDTSLPQPGVMYTLKIKADGFRDVEATDHIPGKAKVLDVQYTRGDIDEGIDITITLDDEAEIENYYAVSLWSSRQIYKQSFSVLNAELTEQMNQFVAQEPFFPYADRPMVEDALIHDHPFDGKQFDLSLSIEFLSEIPSTYVRSVSKAYYDYYLSRIVQQNTEDLWYAEPAPLKSNIRGGHGVFAGYSLHVVGDLSPANVKNQILGTYYLSSTIVEPIESTVYQVKNEFTLHPDYSVTGFIQYPSGGNSGTVSVDGGFTITDTGAFDYLIQLHHDADTFFRNAELEITYTGTYEDPTLVLISRQQVLDARERGVSIQRTFRKREDGGDE